MHQSRHAITFLTAQYKAVLQASYTLGLASFCSFAATPAAAAGPTAGPAITDLDGLNALDKEKPLLVHGAKDDYIQTEPNDLKVVKNIVLKMDKPAQPEEVVLPDLLRIKRAANNFTAKDYVDIATNVTNNNHGVLFQLNALVDDASEGNGQSYTAHITGKTASLEEANGIMPEIAFFSYAQGNQSASLNADFTDVNARTGTVRVQAQHQAASGNSSGAAVTTFYSDNVHLGVGEDTYRSNIRAKSDGAKAQVFLGTAEKALPLVDLTHGSGLYLAADNGGHTDLYVQDLTMSEGAFLSTGDSTKGSSSDSEVTIHYKNSLTLDPTQHHTFYGNTTIQSEKALTFGNAEVNKTAGSLSVTAPANMEAEDSAVVTLQTAGAFMGYNSTLAIDPKTSFVVDFQSASDELNFAPRAYISPKTRVLEDGSVAAGTFQVKKGIVNLTSGLLVSNKNAPDTGGIYLVDGEQQEDATLRFDTDNLGLFRLSSNTKGNSRVIELKKGSLTFMSSVPENSPVQGAYALNNLFLPFVPSDFEIAQDNSYGIKVSAEQLGDAVLSVKDRETNEELPLYIYTNLANFNSDKDKPQDSEDSYTGRTDLSHLLLSTPKLYLRNSEHIHATEQDKLNTAGLTVKTDAIEFAGTKHYHPSSDEPLMHFDTVLGAMTRGEEPGHLLGIDIIFDSGSSLTLREGQWQSDIQKMTIDSDTANGAIQIAKSSKEGQQNSLTFADQTQLHFKKGYLSVDSGTLDLSQSTLSIEPLKPKDDASLAKAKGLKSTGGTVIVDAAQMSVFKTDDRSKMGLILEKTPEGAASSLVITQKAPQAVLDAEEPAPEEQDHAVHLHMQDLVSSENAKAHGGIAFNGASLTSDADLVFESADQNFIFNDAQTGLILAPEVGFMVGVKGVPEFDASQVKADVKGGSFEIAKTITSNAGKGVSFTDSLIHIKGEGQPSLNAVALPPTLEFKDNTQFHLDQGSWTMDGDLIVDTNKGNDYGVFLGSAGSESQESKPIQLQAKNISVTKGLLAVAPNSTLTVDNDFTTAAGTTLQLQAGTTVQVGHDLSTGADLTLAPSSTLTVGHAFTAGATVTLGESTKTTVSDAFTAQGSLSLGPQSSLTVTKGILLNNASNSLQTGEGVSLTAESVQAAGAVALGASNTLELTGALAAAKDLTIGEGSTVQAKSISGGAAVSLGSQSTLTVDQGLSAQGLITISSGTTVTTSDLHSETQIDLEGAVTTDSITLKGDANTVRGSLHINGVEISLAQPGSFAGVDMNAATISVEGPAAQIYFDSTLSDALLQSQSFDSDVRELGHYTLTDGARFHFQIDAVDEMSFDQYNQLKQALFGTTEALDGSLTCNKLSLDAVLGDLVEVGPDGLKSMTAENYLTIADQYQDVDDAFTDIAVKDVKDGQKMKGHIGSVTLDASAADGTVVFDGLNSSLNKATTNKNLIEQNDGTTGHARIEQGTIVSLRADGAVGDVILDNGVEGDRTEIRFNAANTANSVSGGEHTKVYIGAEGNASIKGGVQASALEVQGTLTVGDGVTTSDVVLANGSNTTITNGLTTSSLQSLGNLEVGGAVNAKTMVVSGTTSLAQGLEADSVNVQSGRLEVAQDIQAKNFTIGQGAYAQGQNFTGSSLRSEGEVQLKDVTADSLDLKAGSAFKADTITLAKNATVAGTITAKDLSLAKDGVFDLQEQSKAQLQNLKGGEQTQLSLAKGSDLKVEQKLEMGSVTTAGTISAHDVLVQSLQMQPEAKLTTYDLTIGQQAHLQGELEVAHDLNLQSGAKVDLAVPLQLQNIKGDADSSLALAQGIATTVEGSLQVGDLQVGEKATLAVGEQAHVDTLALASDSLFTVKDLVVDHQADIKGSLQVENMGIGQGAQASMSGDQTFVALNLDSGAQLQVHNGLEVQSLQAAPDAVLTTDEDSVVHLKEHATLGTLNLAGHATLDQGAHVEQLNIGAQAQFHAEKAPLVVGQSAEIQGVLQAQSLDLKPQAALSVEDGRVELDQLVAGEGSLIAVGSDGDKDASGLLKVKYADLQGAPLRVDPSYDQKTALAVIENFGTSESASPDLSVLRGKIYVGQNSALGYGCASEEDLLRVVRSYQKKGALQADGYGAVLYLAKGITIAQGQGMTLTSQSTSDFQKTVNNSNYSESDTLYLGKNTAVFVEGPQFQEDQAYIHFAADNATIIADGGEIVIRSQVKSPELKIFDAQGTVTLEGLNTPDSSLTAVAEEGSRETAASEPFITVRSENGFLEGQLRNGKDGFLEEYVELTPNLEKARTIFSHASDPVINSMVEYFAHGAGENEILNYSLSRGDGSAAERAARLGVYGGALQSSWLAGSALTKAVHNHLDLSPRSIVHMEDEPLDKGMWLDTIYQNTQADGLNADGLAFGSEVDLYGLALGFYKIWDAGLQLGVAFDIGSGKAKGVEEAQGLNNEFDYYGAALYSAFNGENFSLALDAGYTAVKHTMSSDFLAFDQPHSQELSTSASMDSSSLSAGLGMKYDVALGRVHFVPHLDMRYTLLRLDDYSLDGIADTKTRDMEIGSVAAGLGYQYQGQVGEWTITPSLDVGAQYNFGDLEARTTTAWQKTQGLQTDLQSEVVDDWVYSAGLGLSISNGGFLMRVGAEYEGSEHADSYGARLDLQATF